MLTNQSAFCATLAHAEGTARAADPYRVVFGFTHTIADLRDHPAITGEWTGVLYAGGLTTAAGKYQINKPTWLDIRTALRLPDFTGPSQDDAALFLIKRAGALELVNSGQFAAAIDKCRGTWASLPGGSSGQPEHTLEDLIEVYAAAGGAFA